MNTSIDWESVVRLHRDFVTAGADPEAGLGVCLRDGCGSACFYGPLAWFEAADFLGFEIPDELSPEEIRRSAPTGEILDEIARLQDVQKKHPPESEAWRQASAELAPLFEEMSARAG